MTDKIETMTIAQGIRRIAKLKNEVSVTTPRLTTSVRIVKGSKCAFDFDEEMTKIIIARNSIIDLQSRIHIANAKTMIVDGDKTFTIAQAIRVLDGYKAQIALYKSFNLNDQPEKGQELAIEPSTGRHVYLPTTTEYTVALSEKERNDRVTKLQDQFEHLNNLVEAANHKTQI